MAERGRPTKYSAEIIAVSQAYLISYEALGDAFPSVVGLARVLDIPRTTLYEWAEHEDHKVFADILGKINDEQQRVLLNNGVRKRFDSTITKLVLGKHGYSDKQEIKQDSISATAKISTDDYKKARAEMLKDDDC